MSIVYNKNRRLFYVELQKRTSATTTTNSWSGTWVDFTPYLIDVLGSFNFEIDDSSLSTKALTQESLPVKFNNIRGTFNLPNTNGSYWNSAESLYHSRIRIYDFLEGSESGIGYGEKPTTLDPIFDGLLTENITYNIDHTVTIVCASRLDVLRDHYFFDDFLPRVKSVTSQQIITKVIKLLDTTYSSLGITTNGGIVRNSILYTDLSPYDKHLLELLFKAAEEGGGVCGLAGDDLFIGYFGASTVTKASFTADTDAEIVYQFDDTDYASGSGTTLDDKTSNEFDASIDSLLSDRWDSVGHFYNKCRNFYFVNEFTNEVPELDYYLDFSGNWTIEMVVDIEQYLVNISSTIKGSRMAPLLIFTELVTANSLGYADGTTTGKSIGLVIDGTGQLAWTAYDHAAGDVLESYIDIDQLPTEKEVFYIALTFNVTSGEYNYYLDGVLRKTFTDVKGSNTSQITVRKIFTRGAMYFGSSLMDDSTYSYVHAFRLSLTERTAATILSTYQTVYGQEIDLSSTTLHTYSNYGSNQLGNIVSYSSGIDLVKNYILLEKGTNNEGVTEFSFDDSSSVTLQFVFGRTAAYQYTIDTIEDIEEIINYVDNDTNSTLTSEAKTLRTTYGLRAKLGSGIGGSSKSIIIEATGNFDYRNIMIWLYRSGLTIYSDSTKYHYSSYGSGSKLIYLSPSQANYLIVSKDDTSAYTYGKRIHRVDNYDLVNAALDRQLLTSNSLAARKDPKIRMTIRVPYRQNTFTVLDRVTVSLEKEDTRQIPFHLEEGGVFYSWPSVSGYREDTFYIVGISHDKNGTYTQLKLREV